MPQNNVKKLRLARSLTQRTLAELVGTSQQQIQRIESGVQAARLDMAIAIAGALAAPPGEVFPSAQKLLTSVRSNKPSLDFEDEKLSAGFADAGIDLDPRIWTLKYTLRNGLNGFCQLSGPDKHRLWSAMQGDMDLTPFVTFDTPTDRVAINRRHLVFWQFLYDPPFRSENRKTRSEKLTVHLVTNAEPMTFGIDADSFAVDEQHDLNDDTQLQNIFLSLDGYCEPDELVFFVDEDGEYAFFRAADIAMFSVPLWAVEPALWESEMDDSDETGEESSHDEDMEDY